MKKILLLIGFTCSVTLCFGQKHLVSYDGLKVIVVRLEVEMLES